MRGSTRHSISAGPLAARASASARSSSPASSARQRARRAPRDGGVVDVDELARRSAVVRRRGRGTRCRSSARRSPAAGRGSTGSRRSRGRRRVTFARSCTAVTSSVGDMRNVPSPMTTTTSPASGCARRMPMPAGSSWPMHEKPNSMWRARARRAASQSLSRSPGGLPAAATTQSPGRAALVERAAAPGPGSCARPPRREVGLDRVPAQRSRAAATRCACSSGARQPPSARRAAPRAPRARPPRSGPPPSARASAALHVDADEAHAGVCEERARRRREVGQPRADADDEVGLARPARSPRRVPLTPMPPSSSAPGVRSPCPPRSRATGMPERRGAAPRALLGGRVAGRRRPR